MPTRILVVGSGGREHALAWKLANEPGVNEVIVAPGSEAMELEPRVRTVAGIDALDADALVAVAQAASVELVVVGPEAPLARGVADRLRQAGVATFGPSAAAARIESSKAFCREVAEAVGVRMARGRAFDEPSAAIAFAERLADEADGIVVKVDGLAAGKGVTVCADIDEARRAIDGVFGASGRGEHPRVVIEERLQGPEASVIALTDGREVLALPAARDHKRLLDGDRGPNTGGMGGYSPLPDLPDGAVEEVLATIHSPLLAELARRGTPFRGALYAGLILTSTGPALLECNARLGDPETQIALPRLAVPLGPLLLAAGRGDLATAARPLGLGGRLLPSTRDATVAIVLAAGAYPDGGAVGDSIAGLDDARDQDALVFHSGTRRSAGGGFETNGGRVLTVVGQGPDVGAARAAAEAAANTISFAGSQRRHDIAAAPVSAGVGA